MDQLTLTDEQEQRIVDKTLRLLHLAGDRVLVAEPGDYVVLATSLELGGGAGLQMRLAPDLTARIYKLAMEGS